MTPVERLPPEALSRRTDPGLLRFATTAELAPGGDPVGQPRAVAAVRFGVAVADHGYNVFALGPNGTGKRHFVAGFVTAAAAEREVPPDLVYLNDFDEPRTPIAVQLPSGSAARLRGDMQQLVEEVSAALPAAFETEAYHTRLQAIEEEFKQRSADRLDEVRQSAAAQGVALLQTPEGMMFAPLRDGEIVGAEAFAKLPEEDQRRIRKEIEGLQRELQVVLREMPRWQRERRARVRELNREFSDAAVGDLIDDLVERYSGTPRLEEYLKAVRRDLIDNARDVLRLREHQEADTLAAAVARAPGDAQFWRRYRVNVMVDRAGATGAPVVFEDHPTYENLLGRIEHVPQQGTLVTDFTLIRPGALHRANGGYLVLDALKVLQQPFAWDGLKRALRSGKLRTEPVGQAYGLIGTATLSPEPVPLDVKVVLLGDRQLYYLLSAADPDVQDLFKVAADFDDVIDRTPENERGYASLVAAIATAHGLRPFERDAVLRVIEHAARRAGDAERLSANSGNLADVLREANHWAGVGSRDAVTVADIRRAIDEQVFRADRVHARLRDEMLRGTLLVDTEGAKVGHVNGLSVFELASHRFGRPSRITARVRLGRGEILDIEREVELGGPLHSKGVLILSSFIAARFAAEQPLSLSASLVFEQSYGGIEGDSASSAELYALLSAIAEVPVRQGLATTGSVNQYGEVQPVGGVNEKIEGFFDLCVARGLTGDQGVLIPAANAPHLMLRQDVIEAVATGAFHVYPVRTVEEGAELLMGVPLGERDSDGNYPAGSLGERVLARLTGFTRTWEGFARRGPDGPLP